MKTHPILFSTPMVNAIIQNKKSQTRRIIKSRHESGMFQIEKDKTGKVCGITSIDWDERPMNDTTNDIHPKYKIGDVLWVKEVHYRYGYWRKNGISKTGKQKWLFVPDKQFTEIRYFENPPAKIEKNSFRGIGWYKRNSLFMPREAARIFLEVTNVRVERLNNITKPDVVAEGIQVPLNSTGIGSYAQLWDKINGYGSWDKNPWIWVIEFKRINL